MNGIFLGWIAKALASHKAIKTFCFLIVCGDLQKMISDDLLYPDVFVGFLVLLPMRF